MQRMPYHPELDAQPLPAPRADEVVTSDWQRALPVLEGGRFILRELRASDAAALLANLTTEEVTRFISPPPTTVEAFEKFIDWTHRERRAGRFFCFGVVPEGHDAAVGIFQVRAMTPDFTTADWGFVLGSDYWGTGLFAEGAELVMGFAFETIGVVRLEARSMVANGRGNGALRKVGAVREGILRRAFFKNGQWYDDVMWSILAEDWLCEREARAARPQQHAAPPPSAIVVRVLAATAGDRRRARRTSREDGAAVRPRQGATGVAPQVRFVHGASHAPPCECSP